MCVCVCVCVLSIHTFLGQCQFADVSESCQEKLKTKISIVGSAKVERNMFVVISNV